MAKSSRPNRETLTAEHLHDLVFLSDPHLVSDGSRALCVETTIETRKDSTPRYRSSILEVTIPSNKGDTPSVRTVAGGAQSGNASHPRLSPDGRWLAYLHTPLDPSNGKRGDLRMLDMQQGGEPRILHELAGGITRFAWRPDGKKLVLLGRADAPQDPGDVVARTVDRLHSKQDGIPSPGLTSSEATGAWMLDASSRKARALPVPPDGISDVAWHPDGSRLWMIGSESSKEADEWFGRIWELPLSTAGVPQGDLTAVTGALLAPHGLSVNQDGTELAWLAPHDPKDLASPTGLWTVDLSKKRRRPVCRTQADDDVEPALGGDARHGRYPTRPRHSAGGWIVLWNQEGASSPARLHEDGSLAALLPMNSAVTTFDESNGVLVCLREFTDRPGALTLVHEDGSTRTLHDPNEAFIKRFKLKAAEGPFHASSGGGRVAWWRLTPHRTRRDHALVLQVHGGPHTNAGFGFSFEHHFLAAHGYTVVFSNPRGSSSYGNAHATAMIGGYGTVDADDVLAVADHALAEHRSPNAPMHLTGGSYGGFMTNWLVGRTNRFASAVTQRSICNWLSFYGTSDIGYRFAEQEVQGNPWNDFELLWRQSPIRNVTNVTTPILILHSEADHRCPIEQAEQWYVALKRIGKAETKLVRFPSESHELSRSGRPDRRTRRLHEIVGWFEQHA